jgi:alpha-tubulin suppressor-like RCC1 family protein
LLTDEPYTWGHDEGDGRLGLVSGGGPCEAGSLSVPSKVNVLPVPVAAVACGGFFTMVLTSDGQLWSWGGYTLTKHHPTTHIVIDITGR